MDLVLTSLSPKDWEFLDVNSIEMKCEKLTKFYTEKVKELISAMNEGKEKQSGYLDRIKSKVIDNLYIKFKDIHIRVEDNTTGSNCSFGISLDEFAICNTNKDWEETIITKSNDDNEYKLMKITNFGFYVTKSTSESISQTINENSEKENEKIEKILNFNPDNDSYLIKPISMNAKMKNNKITREIDLNVKVENFEINIKKEQYDFILHVMNNLIYYRRFQSFKKDNEKYSFFRPKCEIKGNTRKWFRFAIIAVIKRRKFFLGDTKIFEINEFLRENYHQQFIKIFSKFIENKCNYDKFDNIEKEIFAKVLGLFDEKTLNEWSVDCIKEYAKTNKNFFLNENGTLNFLNFFPKTQASLTPQEEEKLSEILSNFKTNLNNQNAQKKTINFTLERGSLHFSSDKSNFGFDFAGFFIKIDSSESVISIDNSLAMIKSLNKNFLNLKSEETEFNFIYKLKYSKQKSEKKSFSFDLILNSFNIVYAQDEIAKLISFFTSEKKSHEYIISSASEMKSDLQHSTKKKIQTALSSQTPQIQIEILPSKIYIPLSKYNIANAKAIGIEISKIIIKNEEKSPKDSEISEIENFVCDFSSIKIIYLKSLRYYNSPNVFEIIPILKCKTIISVSPFKYEINLQIDDININLSQEIYYTLYYLAYIIKPQRNTDSWASLEADAIDIKKSCKAICAVRLKDNCDIAPSFRDCFAAISGGYIYFFVDVNESDYDNYFYLRGAKIEQINETEINIKNKFDDINLRFANWDKTRSFSNSIANRVSEMSIGYEDETLNTQKSINDSTNNDMAKNNNKDQTKQHIYSLDINLSKLTINLSLAEETEITSAYDYTLSLSALRLTCLFQSEISLIFQIASLQLFSTMATIIKSNGDVIQISIIIPKSSKPTINIEVGELEIEWFCDDIRRILLFIVHNEILCSKIKADIINVPSQSKFTNKFINYFNKSSKFKNEEHTVLSVLKENFVERKSDEIIAIINLKMRTINLKWLTPMKSILFAKVSFLKAEFNAEIFSDVYRLNGEFFDFELKDDSNYRILTTSFDFRVVVTSIRKAIDKLTMDVSLSFTKTILEYYHEFFIRAFNYFFDEFLGAMTTPSNIKKFKNLRNLIPNEKNVENFEFSKISVNLVNPKILLRPKKNFEKFFIIETSNVNISNEYELADHVLKHNPEEKRFFSKYKFNVEKLILRFEKRNIIGGVFTSVILRKPIFFNDEDEILSANEIDKSYLIQIIIDTQLSLKIILEDFILITQCISHNFLYSDNNDALFESTRKNEEEIDFSIIKMKVALKISSIMIYLEDRCSTNIQNAEMNFIYKFTGPNELRVSLSQCEGRDLNKNIAFLSTSQDKNEQINFKYVIDKNSDKNIIISVSNIKLILLFDLLLWMKYFFIDSVPVTNSGDTDIENKPNIRVNFEIKNILICLTAGNTRNMLCLSTTLAMLYKKVKISQCKKELVSNYNTYKWKMENTNDENEKKIYEKELNLDYKEIGNLMISFGEIMPFIISEKELQSNDIPKRKLTNNFNFYFNNVEKIRFVHPNSFISSSSSLLSINDIVLKFSYRDIIQVKQAIEYNTSSIESSKPCIPFSNPPQTPSLSSLIDKGIRLDEISIKTLRLVLIDDHADTYYPFLSLSIKDTSITHETFSSYQSVILISLSAKVIVYNYYIGTWEPIMERSTITVECVKDNADKSLHTLSLTVDVSKNGINLNISDIAISFLYTTLKTWIEKTKEDDSNKVISNHTIVNLTGREMTIMQRKENECKKISSILTNEKYDIEYRENVEDEFFHLSNSNNKTQSVIAVSFDNASITVNDITRNYIKIDSIKTKKHTIDYSRLKSQYKTDKELKGFEYIISEVVISEMKRIITIYSPLIFENTLNRKMLIRFAKKKFEAKYEISPKSRFAVPYEFFDGNIEFRFETEDQPQIFDLRNFLEMKPNLQMRFNAQRICFFYELLAKSNVTCAHISSAIIVRNYLPFSITIKVKGKNFYIHKSSFEFIDNVSPIDDFIVEKIKCLQYKIKSINFTSESKQNKIFAFTLLDSSHKSSINISVANLKSNNGINAFSLYFPSIIINETGLPISIFTPAQNVTQRTHVISLSPSHNVSPIGPELHSIIFHVDDAEKKESVAVSIDGIGLSTLIECISPNSIIKYEFTLSLDLSPVDQESEIFAKIITLYPKYTLVNKTNFDLLIAFDNSETPLRVGSHSKIPICNSSHYIKIRPISDEKKYQSGSKWNWSRQISIDELRDLTMRISAMKFQERLYLHFEKKILDFYSAIIVNLADESNALFLIENRSHYIHLKVSQCYYSSSCEKIGPQNNSLFAWVNEEERVKMLKIEFIYQIANNLFICDEQNTQIIKFTDSNDTIILNNNKRKYPLHQIIIIHKNKYAGYKILFEIKNEGIKTVIAINDYVNSCCENRGTFQIVKELNMKIPMIGISVLSLRKKSQWKRNELCYISLKGIQFYFRDESNETRITEVQCKIHLIQIDNMISYITQFPIILSPDNFDDYKNIKEHPPFFNIAASCYRYSANEPLKFNYFSYLIQAFHLSIDSEILEGFINFVDNITKKINSGFNRVHRVLREGGSQFEDYIEPHWMREDSFDSNNKIFFTSFETSSIEMVLSFKAGDVIEKFFTSNAIVGTILSTMSNIDKADLLLNGCIMHNLYISYLNIITLVLNKYKQSILTEVFTIVGAIDVLGNPSNLFKSLGTGVKEFIAKPVEGIVRGPLEGVEGAIEGGYSLIKHTIGGTFSATSKIATGLSKGLLHLSSNDSYMRKIEKEKLTLKPKNFVYGLGYGITSFANGVFSGICDAIVKPIEETQKNGIGGIGSGLFKGIGGLFSKPVVGVLQMVSTTSEGIKNTFTAEEGKVKQERMPRPFYGRYKYIKTYNSFHAYVVWFIKMFVDEVKTIDFCDVEHYVNIKGEGTFLIFSTKDFIFVDTQRKCVKNKIPYSYVTGIEYDKGKDMIKMIFNEKCKGLKTAEIHLNKKMDNGEGIAKKMQKIINENVDSYK